MFDCDAIYVPIQPHQCQHQCQHQCRHQHPAPTEHRQHQQKAVFYTWFQCLSGSSVLPFRLRRIPAKVCQSLNPPFVISCGVDVKSHRSTLDVCSLRECTYAAVFQGPLLYWVVIYKCQHETNNVANCLIVVEMVARPPHAMPSRVVKWSNQL